MTLKKFTILTLFPELFPGPLGASLVGKALSEGQWQLNVVNIRDYAENKHQNVDDTPYGGGAGMVLRPDILANAMESVQPAPEKWVYLSPRGGVWNQATSESWLEYQHIGLICGRFEGVDQRVLDHFGVEEVSIGDFVLSGGEIAAFAVIDTCIRQVFGVLGNASTIEEESFGKGIYRHLLEYPHYTRPAEWRGQSVPEVLTSGNHQAVDRWRQQQAEQLTKDRRPDLWKRYTNTEQ